MISVLPMVLGGLIGCSGDAPAPAGEPMVTDSAGVTIVQHPADFPDSPVWTAGVEVGLVLDEDFHLVRGVLRLPHGGVVVANAGTRELRFFDREGAPGTRVGRDGEGPGEFRNPALLARWPGDSLFVYDPQLRRATLFGPRGALARSFSLETTGEVPFTNVRGVHADGSLMATGVARLPGPPDGRIRVPSPTSRHRPDGSLEGPLPVEISSEVYFQSLNGGFRSSVALFSLATRLLAGPETLVEASNDSWEVRVRDPAGGLLRIVRRALPPVPVTPALRRQAAEALLDDQAPGPAADDYRRALEAMPVPDHLPAFGRVTVDRRDRIWVEEYQVVPEDQATWIVLDREGAFVARALLPSRLEPMDVGDGWIAGVLRDELDVERVVLAPLVPAG